jgi:hypothetical protein
MSFTYYIPFLKFNKILCRDTNVVVMVSQDSRHTRYNYNGSRKSQGVVCFFVNSLN